MSSDAVDVLLLGAHPDDVEWGAGGLALLLKQSGISFAIVDLTSGEMGSRGTTEERRREALEAGEFLGASTRVCLGLPDCGLIDAPDGRRRIATAIRQHRPRIVLAPYWEDRHPDHTAAGLLVRNSALYCTLTKLKDANPPHKPEAFLYYLLHTVRQPSFVVDTSAVFQRKLGLMRIHRTQFSKPAEELGLLPMGLGDYLYGLESRDRFFGSLIGTRFGEGIMIDRPLTLQHLSRLFPLLQAER
jgi:bacillithiol biosynthesis deacetylase BshB1